MKQIANTETALNATARALARRKGVNVSMKGNDYTTPLSLASAILLPNTNILDSAKDAVRFRGELDLAALSKRFHDHTAHIKKRPLREKEAEVYDRLETMRIEILGAREGMKGLSHNLSERFDEQCNQDRNLPSETDAPWGDMLSALVRQSAIGEAPPNALMPHLSQWQLSIERHARLLIDKLAASVVSQDAYSKLTQQLIEALGGIESEYGKSAMQFAPQETAEESDGQMENTDNEHVESTEGDATDYSQQLG